MGWLVWLVLLFGRLISGCFVFRCLIFRCLVSGRLVPGDFISWGLVFGSLVLGGFVSRLFVLRGLEMRGILLGIRFRFEGRIHLLIAGEVFVHFEVNSLAFSGIVVGSFNPLWVQPKVPSMDIVCCLITAIAIVIGIVGGGDIVRVSITST